jgi:hypothetical protein
VSSDRRSWKRKAHTRGVYTRVKATKLAKDNRIENDFDIAEPPTVLDAVTVSNRTQSLIARDVLNRQDFGPIVYPELRPASTKPFIQAYPEQMGRFFGPLAHLYAHRIRAKLYGTRNQFVYPVYPSHTGHDTHQSEHKLSSASTSTRTPAVAASTVTVPQPGVKHEGVNASATAAAAAAAVAVATGSTPVKDTANYGD